MAAAIRICLKHSVSVCIEPYHRAGRVDVLSGCPECAGYIDRSELAPAKQKSMGLSGHDIQSHNAALGVDALRLGNARAGHIDGRVRALAQQKAMRATVIDAHDVAPGVYVAGGSTNGTRKVDRREYASAQQKTVVLAKAVHVISNHVSLWIGAAINRRRDRARDIDGSVNAILKRISMSFVIRADVKPYDLAVRIDAAPEGGNGARIVE